MRILNILAQPVVVPKLWGSGADSKTSVPASQRGPLSNMTLGCGAYVAYWDGRIAATGREAASGAYLVQLFVDNKLFDTKKIFYSK